jgi:FkbM family methyltransferase
LKRKDFLIGVGGLAVGVPLGAVAGRMTAPEPSQLPPAARPIFQGQMSYAQAGEDMIVNYILGHLQIDDKSYLDIGAYDPVYLSNTYLFYQQGHRGVLIEPNITMCEKLRAVRPRDTVLEAGIGADKPGMADFYVMSHPSWSTFDRAEAESRIKATGGKAAIKEVRKVPLLDVNQIMVQHFAAHAPAFLSIDVEGWELRILKSIDFKRFRPKVICVETLVLGENRRVNEIPPFMAARGYVARGGSFVNTIFVDGKLL